MYSAADGMPNDWHLVHIGSRAIGGAGLVMTEMTDVSPEGRITPGCAGLYSPEHGAVRLQVSGFRFAFSDRFGCLSYEFPIVNYQLPRFTALATKRLGPLAFGSGGIGA